MFRWKCVIGAVLLGRRNVFFPPQASSFPLNQYIPKWNSIAEAERCALQSKGEQAVQQMGLFHTLLIHRNGNRDHPQLIALMYASRNTNGQRQCGRRMKLNGWKQSWIISATPYEGVPTFQQQIFTYFIAESFPGKPQIHMLVQRIVRKQPGGGLKQ